MQSLTFEELCELSNGTQIFVTVPTTSSINPNSVFAIGVEEDKNFVSSVNTGKDCIYITVGKKQSLFSITRREIEEGTIVVFPKDAVEATKQPTANNNDGLLTCQYCGAPTKEVDTGMFSTYRVCTNKECKEWKC